MNLAFVRRLVIHVISSAQIRVISGTEKRTTFVHEKCIPCKEEYRRAYAVKQKMEGLPYRTIAKDIGINYRNVYDDQQL